MIFIIRHMPTCRCMKIFYKVEQHHWLILTYYLDRQLPITKGLWIQLWIENNEGMIIENHLVSSLSFTFVMWESWPNSNLKLAHSGLNRMSLNCIYFKILPIVVSFHEYRGIVRRPLKVITQSPSSTIINTHFGLVC